MQNLWFTEFKKYCTWERKYDARIRQIFEIKGEARFRGALQNCSSAESKRMTEFGELPEGCIAAILSRTTPLDVGRLSLVSKTFCSAAKFDDSFQLERKTGKKCYMLSARSLEIFGADDILSWYWTDRSDSRFAEVANMRFVRWLVIRGMINTNALSPNTQYAAYLVFKTIHAYGFMKSSVVLTVGVEGGHVNTNIVCLDPHVQRRPRFNNTLVALLPRPSVRSDGWLEIEMGEFFNSGLEDVNIQMNAYEIVSGLMKTSFTLEGIEVRPKVDN
ncbi:hypothetical protein P8452_13263 [Trifolium repens]|nr:hypothetical protein P8452_13263 [Trifolium repens]